jgi:hypothetical protein
MPVISSLTVYAVVIGSAMLAACLAKLVFPQTIQAWLAAFPRNIWAGRILAAIDVALVAWLLATQGFEWVDARRQLLYLAAPAAYLLIVFFMDELLSVRALGGLVLLIPFWILDAAFLHPMQSRLVMTAFAYLMVVVGMALVWSPYLFRKFMERLNAHAGLGFAGAVAGSLLGLAMIVLGVVVY